MGTLHSHLNFFPDLSVNFALALSLLRDSLYFLDSLATPKVRKFAKTLLRCTCRSPGRAYNIYRQASFRIHPTDDQSSDPRVITKDGVDLVLA